jgi:hypothetical protein
MSYDAPQFLLGLHGGTAAVLPKAPTPRPTDARAVLQAAVDGLEDDPMFPPDVMEALRAADAHWENGPTDNLPDQTQPGERLDLGQHGVWVRVAGGWKRLPGLNVSPL